MRRNHPTLLLGALLGIAGVLALANPGTAQQGFAKSIDIYTGGNSEGEGIKLGGWGSGLATEDRGTKGPGEQSIKVETSGFYSGARIEFERPREITDQKNDPFGFLEFTMKFQPGKPKQPRNTGGYPGGAGNSGGAPGFGGNSGGSGGEFGGNSGGPGGELGGGGYPGGPGGGLSGQPETLVPDTRRMKVLLICEEGSYAANLPVTLNNSRDEGWYTVAMPFMAFKGLDKSETAKLKEIRVFGDTKDTFWIGEIRTTTDDEPISVDALDELEVSVGEPVEFQASATGGISPLQYTWDFDFADGASDEDASGFNVVHVFRKPSNPVPGQAGELQPIVVTLTVKDVSGAKKPVRVITNVIVNP